ncbi:MAG: aldo/keto reductase [Bacillota bacterium]
MNYRVMGKTGDKVSVLGFGLMRLPRKNGKVDIKRAKKQVIMAVERGVNYFDTAYIYGRSESIFGDILEEEGLRESVKIATKLPIFMVHSAADMDNILGTQLKRLRTGYVDYYLLHAVNDFAGWERLKRSGVVEFAEQAKKDGRIRYFGFSYHGGKEDFKAIIDDYPWDFCQIQYNFIDEYFQAGREGLEYAASKGLGVVVMEPLRGGSLAGRIPGEIREIWDAAKVKRTPADWALRWLWDQPAVTVALSGMNEEAQIEENVRTACEVQPGSLTEEEFALYEKVRKKYNELMKVGCTGCGYCMPCPAGVDIPFCFSYYNAKHFFKAKRAWWQYIAFAGGLTGGRPSYASLCKQCGKCEKACPQRLPIRKKLGEVASDMEPKILRPVLRLVRKYYVAKDKKRVKK